ncbi:restriction endonuclease subunit S [Streptomyces galilaeus]|uniref:restriction endonuclease subunit S n=1 Tax=Streptomyces TaxID=1883 RepID=UPI0037F30439
MTWPTVPLRRLVTCLDGRRVPLNSQQRAEMGGSIPYWGAGGVLDFVDQAIFDEPLVLLKEDGSPFFIPEKGVAYYVEGPTWVNNHIHALRATGVDGRFLAFALNCVDYSTYLTGSTRDKLTQEDLKKIDVWLPPLEEQHRIADFLDAETARIDSLTAARERQVYLASARLAGLAKQETGRSFVRGTTVLPKDWQICPLRRAIRGIKTGTTPSGSGPELWIEGTHRDAVPWYGPSSFEGLMHLGPPGKHLPKNAVAERVVPRFPTGSVLIIGIGATAGKVAYLDHDATGNQQITALTPERDVSGRFLSWQLWAATEELRELAPYTTLPIINNDFLKSFPVAMPSGDIQVTVAQSLDRAAARVGALQASASRASTLVKERRQALITAAVTGQFDVSTASGRNVTEGVSV